MKQQTQLPYFAALGLAMSAVSSGYGQTLKTGPSTSTTPYLQTVAAPGNSNGIWVESITSFLTAKNTVQLTGGSTGSTYEMGGVPDGLGAFDNGDGTITLLVNHEIGANNISTGSGVNGDITTGTHAHGGTGSYVSQWIVNKSTLQVVSGKDLINTVVDTSGVSHYAGGTGVNAPLSFARFCSADLAGSNAFFNPVSGFGTTDRIFMNGEESTGGGTNGTGRVLANVVTGSSAGTSYMLAGWGASGTQGSWENFLAHPNTNNVLGNTTVVMGNSDGGTGITNGAVGIYVGTKNNTGATVADRAGLTGGTFSFISVTGANDTSGTTIDELSSTTTRASAITTGTRFGLSATSPTTFSRPEDGAWDPTNPNRYYFVTTDRIDGSTAAGGGQTNPTAGSSGAGTQIGMSRLWALNFDDITNPSSGGTISLLIDGGKPNQKVQMFDNMTVDATGRIFLNEDPGNSTYNGKIWTYDPTTDALTMLTKFDTARWGDLASAGGTPGFTGTFTNDKETSGILDVTSLFTSTPGVGEKFLLATVQDHSTANGDTFSVEGGQLVLLHTAPEPGRAMLLGLGLGAAILRRRRK